MPAKMSAEDYVDALNRHYAPGDVWQRIQDSVRATGRDPSQLSRDEMAMFDEFHGGGRESTRALARFAGLKPGQQLLDIGCGIGGPARTLAAEFGAEVIGVDLTLAFVEAADKLSTLLDMQAKTRFLHGSALALPVVAASVDVVWSQNMLMNIEDKSRFVLEVSRVLRPGGILAFEAVVAGSGDVHYPAFWSATAELSFLVTAPALRALLTQAGLRELAWQDNTAQVLAVARKRLGALTADARPQLGIGVIVPDRVIEKTRNGLRNNEEGRTLAVQAIYAKPM